MSKSQISVLLKLRSTNKFCCCRCFDQLQLCKCTFCTTPTTTHTQLRNLFFLFIDPLAELGFTFRILKRCSFSCVTVHSQNLKVFFFVARTLFSRTKSPKHTTLFSVNPFCAPCSHTYQYLHCDSAYCWTVGFLKVKNRTWNSKVRLGTGWCLARWQGLLYKTLLGQVQEVLRSPPATSSCPRDPERPPTRSLSQKKRSLDLGVEAFPTVGLLSGNHPRERFGRENFDFSPSSSLALSRSSHTPRAWLLAKLARDSFCSGQSRA